MVSTTLKIRYQTENAEYSGGAVRALRLAALPLRIAAIRSHRDSVSLSFYYKGIRDKIAVMSLYINGNVAATASLRADCSFQCDAYIV
ncbi:unnamed protein product, partial [Brenthis ino]